MKHIQQLFRLVGWFVVGLALFAWGQPLSGHAATLANGSYQVPLKILKADSQATSTASQFFGKSAVVRVNDDQYTVLITSTGAQYIKSMTVAGQTVTKVKTTKSAAIYQFNLTEQKSPLTTTFSLTTPLGAMKETARLTLGWAQAKSLSSSLATSDLIAQAVKLIPATSSSASIKVPKTTGTTTSTQTSKAAKTTTKPEYWRYQVLQGSKMAKSEADQYYTKVATVTPQSTGYRVLLKVAYAKSLKLGSKAVVPESIDGQQPQDVTYGQQGKNYTMQYAFTVKRTGQLTQKLIPGRIHVTVPAMNISQTFPVRFRFASSGAADQADAANVSALPKTTTAAATPTSGSSAATSSHAQPTRKAELPATGEQRSLVPLLGVVGLASLAIGGRFYVKKH
ncbi:NEAT domain-containing protein [Levilactobacillus suantsaiihabitans]|uniref:Cell surface protein n=1 Tax=Levilactobacillus suantsaiihabitans TaxID=2487722 RepID=A0A4Z0J9Z4_9LACO|nr:NEAT domain-containing protein [Levilactobacillus suantsaiihabitans]TGD19571.1 cell surface protein [Levilactobacillus suantsaiihabitans]